MGEFIEIHVSTDLSICEERDPKGLYKKARAGEIKHFTGIDSAYEAPEAPELIIDAGNCAPNDCAEKIFTYLRENDYI
jgi:adenylylsulfate kinase-like enzyme